MTMVDDQGPAGQDAARRDRLVAVWTDIVVALKHVVRAHRVTQDELHVAGRFLNRLGQSGMSSSLVDVALAMTSVAVAGDAGGGTRSNLEGPYHKAHPPRVDGRLFDGARPAGMPALLLSGVVTDAVSGAPLAGVTLDFWQADSTGLYDRQGDHLRGMIVTGADGRYRVETVVPEDYSEHDFDPIGELFRAMGKPNTRAAHIHVRASIGGDVVLTTQLFMSTSGFLDKDYVEGAVSDDLVVALVPDGADGFTARFDFRLNVPGA